MLKTRVQAKYVGCLFLIFFFFLWKLLELSLKICFGATLCTLMSEHDLCLRRVWSQSITYFIRILHLQLQKVEMQKMDHTYITFNLVSAVKERSTKKHMWEYCIDISEAKVIYLEFNYTFECKLVNCGSTTQESISVDWTKCLKKNSEAEESNVCKKKKKNCLQFSSASFLNLNQYGLCSSPSVIVHPITAHAFMLII